MQIRFNEKNVYYYEYSNKFFKETNFKLMKKYYINYTYYFYNFYFVKNKLILKFKSIIKKNIIFYSA